jgi:hypothetical protein
MLKRYFSKVASPDQTDLKTGIDVGTRIIRATMNIKSRFMTL